LAEHATSESGTGAGSETGSGPGGVARPPRSERERRRLRLIRGGLAVAVVAVVAAGVVVLMVIVALKPEPPRDESPARSIVVRAMTAAPSAVRREYRGYGSARAVGAVDVSAEIDGVIVEQPERLEEGVRVDRGELLVRIDPSDYRDRAAALERSAASLRAQLDQLDVEAASAREEVGLAEEATGLIDAEIERLRAAASRGAATANEIDQLRRQRVGVRREEVAARERLDSVPARRARLEAELASTGAQLEEARRDLERTAVESPIVGAIQMMDVEPGERVRVGDVIARVVDPRRLEIPLRLPVSASTEVRPGDSVRLTPDGPGAASWDATVARMAPEADPATRTITCYAEMVQEVEVGAAPALPPGRFVVGSVAVSTSAERVIVPRGAVVDDRVMMIEDDGRVATRRVSVDFYIEASHPELVDGETQWAALREGVRPGERVVVSNLTKLREGMLVEAAPAAAGERARTAEGAPDEDGGRG